MLKNYMRCNYEISGEISLFIRNNIKKTVLKDLVLQNCIHNKLKKEK